MNTPQKIVQKQRPRMIQRVRDNFEKENPNRKCSEDEKEEDKELQQAEYIKELENQLPEAPFGTNQSPSPSQFSMTSQQMPTAAPNTAQQIHVVSSTPRSLTFRADAQVQVRNDDPEFQTPEGFGVREEYENCQASQFDEGEGGTPPDYLKQIYKWMNDFGSDFQLYPLFWSLNKRINEEVTWNEVIPGLTWDKNPQGAPILPNSLISIECTGQQGVEVISEHWLKKHLDTIPGVDLAVRERIVDGWIE